MKVRIKKLHKDAVIPTYSKDGDAGMDLTAISAEWNNDNTICTYDTGISIEIPKGYVGLLFPRSSVSKTKLQLANSVGVIDSGYRGSIMFKYRHPATEEYIYREEIYYVGERIGQILIIPYPQIEFEEVDKLSDTDRGSGGFGSTNK